MRIKPLGPSQNKVIEYLKLRPHDWISLSEIGEKVGGMDLTNRRMRGTSWACQVIRPLVNDGIIEKRKTGPWLRSSCRIKPEYFLARYGIV